MYEKLQRVQRVTDFLLLPVSLFTNCCFGQEHQILEWDDSMTKMSGQEGMIIQEDEVGHFFPKPTVDFYVTLATLRRFRYCSSKFSAFVAGIARTTLFRFGSHSLVAQLGCHSPR